MDFFQHLPTSIYVSGVIALFLVLYRKDVGYRYRCFMSVFLLVIVAMYGVLAALVLPIFSKTGLINYTVARGYYYLGSFFTGLRCVVSGENNILLSPAIYVCNHQSSLDTMVMGAVFPKNTSIVAKKEIKYYPFLGWFMILSKAIFLDRKNRSNALKEAKKAAENIHKNQTSVWLFPEGTRGHSTKIDLLPFKKGAFYMAVQARVPIVPVVIENYHHIYSTQEKRFIPGSINIKVLPPILTNDISEDSTSIEELSVRVHKSMLTALRDISLTSKED